MSRPLSILAVAILASTTAGAAQAQRLPDRNPGEVQAGRINRSMDSQNQIRGIEQQQQFNTNQLRSEQMRSQSIAPPPSVGGPSIVPLGR